MKVEWKRESYEITDLIWRIPNEKIPKIDNVKEIIVKEYEMAILISSGIIKKVLFPGSYKISKDVTEIVWIDVSPKTLKFGVSKSSTNLRTADGKVIGISGTITLNVRKDEGSVRLFFLKVVAGRKSLNCEQIADYLLRQGALNSAIQDVIGKLKLEDLLSINRSKLDDMLTSSLAEELKGYGIEVSSVHLVGVAKGS